ncbi:MAG: hypothetical protein AAGF23_27420 [Acidobacteriota bacterium]
MGKLIYSTLLALLCGAASVAAEPVCGGHLDELPFDVAPPAPPQEYDPPAGAIPVSSTTELQALLDYDPATNQTPMDIVLSDGTYTAEGLDGDFLTLHGSHRLWADNVGQARLTFGIHIGSHGNEALAAGAELHGLHIDIADEAHGAVSTPAHRSFAVLTWGTARGVKIEDCVIEGGDVVDFGIGAYRADGLEVRRVVVRNFKRFGLRTAMADNREWTGPSVVEDIDVERIGDNAWAWSLPPGDPDYDPAYPHYDPLEPYTPSQEVGIWMGAPGRLTRAKVRDIARVGVIAAGRAFGVIMEDLDVNLIGWRESGPNSVNGAGLYFDNVAYRSTFRRFCVGSEVSKGVVSEWDNGTFRAASTTASKTGWSRPSGSASFSTKARSKAPSPGSISATAAGRG